MFPILRLIRFPNLTIIALTLYAFRFCVIRPYYAMSGTAFQLSDLQFGLMVGITMMIAATGYIINDYYDVDIDRVNRPEKPFVSGKITLRLLFSTALLLSFLVLIVIIFFAAEIHSAIAAAVLLLALVTVWWYAKHLKYSFLLGNLAVALMSALTLGMAWFFEWLRLRAAGITLYEVKSITQFAAGISLFAFLLSLMREMVKDMEDMEGDGLFGCRSVPVVKGLRFSKLLVTGLGVILFVFLVLSQVWMMHGGFQLLSMWLIPAVEIPLFLFLFFLTRAASQASFHRLSLLLKGIMVGGISSMILVWINLML